MLPCSVGCSMSSLFYLPPSSLPYLHQPLMTASSKRASDSDEDR